MLTLFMAFLIILTGTASRYNPGVMQRVIEYRQSQGQLPENLNEYVGGIAVSDCANIGKAAIVCYNGDCAKTIVADCASKSDHQSDSDPRSGYQWMVDNGIVCELGHTLVEYFDLEGKPSPQVTLVIVGD